MAKQTGPAYAVKSRLAARLARLAVVCAVTAVLAACASAWHNPHKNAQEAAADEKACSADAEHTALARAARQKEDYGMRQPPMPGLNRGETPMQLHDRVGTEDTFNDQFERCMTSKGYTQGKATP